MPGPGEYVPDVTEGITRVEDLPKPRIEHRSRNYPACRCGRCGRRAGRYALASRTLHDLGDPRSNRPVDLVVTYSKHHCPHCDCYFSIETAPGAARSRQRQQRRLPAFALPPRLSHDPCSTGLDQKCSRTHSVLASANSETITSPSRLYSNALSLKQLLGSCELNEYQHAGMFLRL
jgi:hypothetical protein